MKTIPKRYWRNLDIPLIIAVLGLIFIGLVVIYSASSGKLISENTSPFHFVKKQALSAILGFIGIFIVLSIDYRAWRRWVRILYLINLLILAFVLIIGTTSQNSQRWFRLGGFNVQPSEIAKIVIIIILAHYLDKPSNFHNWKVLIPFVIIGLPMILIVQQPDLGTSMVFVGILFLMLYMAGGNIKHLLLIGFLGSIALAAALLLSYYDIIKIIKPYQLRRLFVFIDPYSDPTDTGWNVIQSMIAIGSGGFFGKGFLNGTQSQLHFLPANHTDFIFSVVAEEFGFIGSVLVISIFALIIWRGLKIARLAKDRYGMLLAIGCVSFFLCHLVVNVGMTLGIMPITGIPLPFLTYGGSSLLTSLLVVGILLNVGLRRQKIMF